MLILLDPSMTFKTVALLDCVDCAILLPVTSETGQQSPTLYLILKMPLDPVQGLMFLIRLVNPRRCPNTGNYILDERIACMVSDNISYIMLANRKYG